VGNGVEGSGVGKLVVDGEAVVPVGNALSAPVEREVGIIVNGSDGMFDCNENGTAVDRKVGLETVGCGFGVGRIDGDHVEGKIVVLEEGFIIMGSIDVTGVGFWEGTIDGVLVG